MRDVWPYRLLADAVITLHFGVVAFVVGGLALIIIGNFRAWRWVNGLPLRVAHAAAVVFVVAEAWLGATCPLTSLEIWLRAKAHTPTYGGSFVGYWLQRLIYYEAPSWIFTFGYSLFAALVAATWWYFPPASSGRRANRHA